jgi:hypothetical protein
MGFEQFVKPATAQPEASTLTAADVLPQNPQARTTTARPAGTTEGGGGSGGGGGGNGGTEGGGGGDTNTNNNKNVNKNINKSTSNASAFEFGGVGGGFCTTNVGAGASFLGFGGGAEHSKVDMNCVRSLQTHERFKWTLDSLQADHLLQFNMTQEAHTDANARAANANARDANANTDRKTSCEAASNLANAATGQYAEILTAGQQTATNGYADSVAKSLSPSAVYLAGKSLVAADACVPSSPPPIEIPPITAVTITHVEAPKPVPVAAPHLVHKPVHHVTHPCTTDAAAPKK